MRTDNLGARIAAYIEENITVQQGPLSGEPFKVLSWQKKFLLGAFKKPFGASLLSVARGNGKTTLVSAIICAALDPAGPLHLANSECLVVAGSLEQARVSYRHIKSFMQDKINEAPALWRASDSRGYCEISRRDTGAAVRLLGQNPKTAHGRSPSLILCDEIAQWPENKSGAMLSALRTSLGKQAVGWIIYIGTRAADPVHWSRSLEDSGTLLYKQVHAATPAQIESRAGYKNTWLRANPSLAAMPSLERAIKQDYLAAKKDRNLLPAFRALRLNGGVSDTLEEWLIEPESWRLVERDTVDHIDTAGPICWGIDLGGSASMSAIACYNFTTGLVRGLACFPAMPSLLERGKSDGVADRYVSMSAEQSLITLGDGMTVPVPALIQYALDRFGVPTAIFCDRWRIAELRDALRAAGLRVHIEPRGMGWRDGSSDVRSFRRAVLEQAISAPKSLLFRSGIGSARLLVDPAGNAKLATRMLGGRRAKSRDDIVAAMILAVAGGRRLVKTIPRPLQAVSI